MVMTPQPGMLVYNHTTNEISHEEYGEPGMAYWHGSLNYMPLGEGKGFLISLMGEVAPAGVPIEDLPDKSDEHGAAVSSIPTFSRTNSLRYGSCLFNMSCYIT
jgi:hypothetical protein